MGILINVFWRVECLKYNKYSESLNVDMLTYSNFLRILSCWLPRPQVDPHRNHGPPLVDTGMVASWKVWLPKLWALHSSEVSAAKALALGSRLPWGCHGCPLVVDTLMLCVSTLWVPHRTVGYHRSVVGVQRCECLIGGWVTMAFQGALSPETPNLPRSWEIHNMSQAQIFDGKPPAMIELVLL